MMKKILVPLLILAGLSSCKTSSIMIDVLRPAEINLPSEIKTLAVVNRSLPDKEAEVNNLVEGIITGEALLADRFGSRSCISGFASAMRSSPRFQVVVPELSLKGTGTDQMPSLMEWALVEDICTMNDADALIALETFDSNTGGRVFALLNQTPGQNLTVEVQAGWRVYHPQTQSVIDESTFTDYMDWDRPVDGYGPEKQQVVEDAGYFAGTRYAARISPSWMSVSRMYFKKGNRDFKEAKRLVRLGMFDEASRLWEQYTNHPERKVAGYACYNMALATELKGDLEGALEWATRAYREYRVKEAPRYMNVLNYRIEQSRQLDVQLENE